MDDYVLNTFLLWLGQHTVGLVRNLLHIFIRGWLILVYGNEC